MQYNHETKQILIILFLLCFSFISSISAQPSDIERRIGQAQMYFDNGNYSQAIETAGISVEEAKKVNSSHSISKSLDILASAQISLQKYKEAEKNLYEALQNIPIKEKNEFQKAQIYLRFAWLQRSQGKFAEALDYSKKAIAILPNNQQILAEHYLNIGRILFTSGFDISAIIWLEKAEKLMSVEKTSSAKLDAYRFLALAWWAKLNYQVALKYTEKWEIEAENTRFKQQYRQALFDSSTILSESGQKTAAFHTLKKGLKLASEQNNSYQAGLFLTSLLLNSLVNNEIVEAADYLNRLEKIKENNLFSFETLLGKAIISAYTNQPEKASEFFSKLDKMENSSEFILPGWKLKIAERNKNWEDAITINQTMLDLTLEGNFRDVLPAIYLDFSRAYFHLGKFQLSEEYLEKSLGLIEELRKSDNSRLSLGILETYHDAYRMLTQIKADKPKEAFELADFVKARLLKDRVNNSALRNNSMISTTIRTKLEDLSLKFIENQNIASEIEKTEKFITAEIPELNLNKPDLSGLDAISSLEDSALVSYFFTVDKKLMAFVWEKDQPLQMVYLSVSENEIDEYAKTIGHKIKNFIFFKRDGKDLYDKLLKPLHLTAKHLILVPDKSLWKIPFQALSSDGEKYLIEEKTISYAPSVSILLEQLKKPKPNRQTLQAYVNSSFENRFLQYANDEAITVAKIFNSKPVINAAINDFRRMSEKSDILHFSMHAEVNNENPLNSFLGFRKIGKDDGRLTVEELLSIKVKKGSLVFLASCDTNNVLNGEGLVSLSWGMLASGATTVVSAGWEANDKSTANFTTSFYKNYRQGSSVAEAMQKAALELIKNKSINMHEPYYWAEFSANGDFR
jgi:CHAT domain-containing protein/tetratricopeptide (TPR) repeat protein